MDTDSTISETIFALSSAPGRGGVAVIRVSGPKAKAIADQMVGIPARPLEPRQARLARIRHPVSGTVLDHGMTVLFPGPNSFTGEDTVEFQVHGGPAVVRAVLDALSQVEACRMAEPGEFTRRAFACGRLDLAEVEGLADLIDAETEAQRVQALRQSEGVLSKLYEDWRGQLIRARAGLEAAIDFSDEQDVARASVEGVDDVVAALCDSVSGHLADGNRGEIVRDGFKIVLAGPPNVGKSSLLNTLARRDAAIVSAHAGTTRDVVEVRLDLGGYAVVVTDTAGIREATGEVEQEGIRRTIRHAGEADLIVWMVDASAPSGPPPADVIAANRPALVVFNKRDLVVDVDPQSIVATWDDTARGWLSHAVEPIAVSTTSNDGISDLTRVLREIVRARIGDVRSPMLSRARHRRHLSACHGELERYIDGAHNGEIELKAELLRAASDALGRITGRVDVEDVLDDVFGQFCIGK